MLNYKHLHYFLTVAKTGSVTRAAEKLHLTPQTLSGQISQFENRLNIRLFKRAGRHLELTEMGRLALNYAEEMFQIGTELEEMLRGASETKALPFRVGITDVVPKTIAHRLLSPVVAMAEPVRLICREDSLEHLLADLAIHRLDMVLADRPLPSGIDVKGYSHPLGESSVAFFAAPTLIKQLSGDFPQCLNGAPFLLPSDESALRGLVLRWLERHQLHPRIVGEFDDTALMKAFGQANAGVFPAMEASISDVEKQHDIIKLGGTTEIKERFFAISVERKITHPAIKAVTEHARDHLFN